MEPDTVVFQHTFEHCDAMPDDRSSALTEQCDCIRFRESILLKEVRILPDGCRPRPGIIEGCAVFVCR